MGTDHTDYCITSWVHILKPTTLENYIVMEDSYHENETYEISLMVSLT